MAQNSSPSMQTIPMSTTQATAEKLASLAIIMEVLCTMVTMRDVVDARDLLQRIPLETTAEIGISLVNLLHQGLLDMRTCTGLRRAQPIMPVQICMKGVGGSVTNMFCMALDGMSVHEIPTQLCFDDRTM